MHAMQWNNNHFEWEWEQEWEWEWDAKFFMRGAEQAAFGVDQKAVTPWWKHGCEEEAQWLRSIPRTRRIRHLVPQSTLARRSEE